jgi:intraflagellar transport protein 140
VLLRSQLRFLSYICRYLAVGTQGGWVAVWLFNGSIRDVGLNRSSVAATSASDWELQYKTQLGAPVVQLTWHWAQGTVAALIDDKESVCRVIVLSESVMHSSMSGDISVVQCSNSSVSIHLGGLSEAWVEDTGVVIKGLSVSRSCFVVWNGKMARVYRVDPHLRSIEPIEPFLSAGLAMAVADNVHITEESLFVCDQSLVRIVNFGGVQKGSISFTEAEGLPSHVDINGKYLAVLTNTGVVKILDVTAPTKPKLLGSAGRVYDPVTGMEIGSTSLIGKPVNASNGNNNQSADDAKANCYLNVRKIRVNCDGTRVAVLIDFVEGSLQIRHPDSKLLIYDRNKGGVNTYDFDSVKRCPVNISWDDTDDRILVCEARRNRSSVARAPSSTDGANQPQLPASSANNGPEAESESEIDVFIFFVTTEDGLLMQDSFPRKYPLGSLLGISVPRLYFRSAPTLGDEEPVPTGGSAKMKIHSKIMRDFVGMDNIDMNAAAKLALLDFSYNLTLGKLDEAYRAIKTIDSPTVWENMAQMCIKTKRLDVAEVCLGHMGHARGAAALRESRKDGNTDVSVGVLAIQLGLNDEAARLFREAGRFDMLNKLYQCAGIWDKAIRVANNFDRIHLKTTHYHFAKYLESVGDVDNAILHYEQSGNARTEVPRMLFDNDRIDDLEDYVHKSDDKLLLKWWGAYLESNERYEKACKYYKKSGDFLSLVRISCFKEDFNQASEIVQECGDRAAAYHFARQLELRGDYQAAIDFYADAGCYNHSIRLARAYGMDSELMRFALKSTTSLMLDCASYFEGKGEFDKAVQLYHKGGDLPRALDLCFKAGEAQGIPVGGSRQNQNQGGGVFDMLNAVAQDLGAETSPQTLARCAEFLVLHKQFERAVELYVMAKRYNQAIDMCLQHRVNINEEMANLLTPPDSMEASERRDILCDLGKALKKQGTFALASNKYALAGDRVRAIKCLVRNGDTAAVIKFAKISKNAEIYTLAANYLQQMNCRESVEIMKSIVLFYTQARAFEQLASFYDSCAQVEIDEFRDYEKAIGALKEALKHLAKANTRSAGDMTELIEKRIVLIEKFVQAKKSVKRDPDTMVSICEVISLR